MKRFLVFAVSAAAFFVVGHSCKKIESSLPVRPDADTGKGGYVPALYNSETAGAVLSDGPTIAYCNFPERFETGSKEAYPAESVALATGTWLFDDAIIGRTEADHKVGNAAARITGSGSITMSFDVKNGVSEVSIGHALYGDDVPATWELWYSTDGGSLWTEAGSVTTSSIVIDNAVFPLNKIGNVRFQVRKTGGGRINIDEFSIIDNNGNNTGGTVGGPATRDDNLGLGNPSSAATSDANNYLLVKPQYTVSYNNSAGIANWVSWHLSTAWKGTATRCDCFSSDNTLPSTYFHATTSNYTGSGFDRGHLCPSDDRDGSSADNAATFMMTNISPQSPVLNQQVWGDLEAYCRTLITKGNELYIIAGSYGQGGTGSLGGATTTIANGKISVPAHYWKVIVVLPIGTSDATRVASTTRVIAIDMPNQQSVGAQTWGYYRTTIDAIEAATGYDLLSNVPVTVQSAIEARTDNGPTK